MVSKSIKAQLRKFRLPLESTPPAELQKPAVLRPECWVCKLYPDGGKYHEHLPDGQPDLRHWSEEEVLRNSLGGTYLGSVTGTRRLGQRPGTGRKK